MLSSHRTFGLIIALLCCDLLAGQSFKVVGYLPSYRFDEIENFDLEKLTHLAVAFANPDENGRVAIESHYFEEVIQKGHASGNKLLLSLAGGNITPRNWKTGKSTSNLSTGLNLFKN